jgi:hypothetical protein
VALVIVILNLVDAFGTLRNVARGADELNPLMAWLLDAGPRAFFAGKFLLAAAGVVGILACGRTRAARFALVGILLPLYLLVAAYQLLLFAVI